MHSRLKGSAMLVGLFALAFFAGPFAQLNNFTLMPGDYGDARLNNYFLENIFQYFKGAVPSLWHLNFFYPFPYIIGFSDNLFGSAPVYLFARIFTGEPYSAFQLWYLTGYFFNYCGAYYALRVLKQGRIAAVVGALIFSFALPVSAHSGHAQLHYRFAMPLSLSMLILFLEKHEWRHLLLSTGWLVWQFYCTIYIGFFTLLFLVAAFCIHCITSTMPIKHILLSIIKDLVAKWCAMTAKKKVSVSLFLFILLILMVILFYPYYQVTQLYGFQRSWSEISIMLPRMQSYFLADQSWLWSSQSPMFDKIPMRHEHQMFVGAVPMLLALAGMLIGSRKADGHPFILLGGSLCLLMLLTLHLGGASLWYFVSKLPLVSSIRAMTRIDLVFLFPIAYLSALSIDRLRNKVVWGTKCVVLIVLPLLIFELSATSPPLSTKASWRERLDQKMTLLPDTLPEGSVVFFALEEGPFYADEMDAMWASLIAGVPTINGYSGFYPPGYNPHYGKSCDELNNRLESYYKFSVQSGNNEHYRAFVERVVLIGFDDCSAPGAPLQMGDLSSNGRQSIKSKWIE